MALLGSRVTAGVVACAVCVLTWVAPATAAAQTPAPPAPTPSPTLPPEPSPPPPEPTTAPPPPPAPAAPSTPVGPAPVAPRPSADGPADPRADMLGDYAHDVMSAHSMAVAEAEALLKHALSDLEAAKAALTKAEAEAAAARTALEQARKAVTVAAAEEKRVREELADILRRISDARDNLGAVARDAYQGTGLATLSVVLDANTPTEYADNYIGVRTVLRAGDSALGELAVHRADLANARERLTAVREEKENLAVKAADAVKAKEAAAAAAATAQQELAEAAEDRVAALEAAEQARLRDYERYKEFLAESQALRLVIVDLSGLLLESATTLYGTGSFVRPGTGAVTSAFGIRRHPITGVVKLHTGTDIGVGDGYVYAADAGTVVKAEWNRAYGYMTVIDHGNGVTTLYGHQASMFVRAGDRVAKGARIGVIGSTGYSTGPHLHFEIRQDGEPVDPWPLIAGAPLPSLALNGR